MCWEIVGSLWSDDKRHMNDTGPDGDSGVNGP